MIAPHLFSRIETGQIPLPNDTVFAAFIKDARNELLKKIPNYKFLSQLARHEKPFDGSADDLTMGDIVNVIDQLAKGLIDERDTEEIKKQMDIVKCELEDLKDRLQQLKNCRNSLMHGKIENLFQLEDNDKPHGWNGILKVYLHFRIEFPRFLPVLNDAVERYNVLRSPAHDAPAQPFAS